MAHATFNEKSLADIAPDMTDWNYAHPFVSIPSHEFSMMKNCQELVGMLSTQADCSLISCTGKRVPASKVILSSRSPVFAAMFDTDMLEKKSSEVTLDYSTEALEAFVKILYCQPDLQCREHLVELMELFDCYQIGKNIVDIVFCIARFIIPHKFIFSSSKEFM